MPKPTYIRVLSYLRAIGEAASVPEIADDLALSHATVRAVIKILLQDGRVRKLGISSTNARCYGITLLGREALAAQTANS